MTKHTPGPWLYRGKSDAVHEACETHPYGNLIFRFHDEQLPSHADLALVLSAPDLLAALVALEEAARQVMAGEMAPSSIMVERLKARAAIAKAEGADHG